MFPFNSLTGNKFYFLHFPVIFLTQPHFHQCFHCLRMVNKTRKVKNKTNKTTKTHLVLRPLPEILWLFIGLTGCSAFIHRSHRWQDFNASWKIFSSRIMQWIIHTCEPSVALVLFPSCVFHLIYFLLAINLWEKHIHVLISNY